MTTTKPKITGRPLFSPGDKVTFHVLSRHTCDPEAGCHCMPDWHLPATFVDFARKVPVGRFVTDLVLDVEFPADSIVTRDHEMVDGNGNKVLTTVTTQGYVGRQSSVPQARTDPPTSGTWTAE